MAFTSVADLSDSQKQELVASLASIIAGTSGSDVTAESLSAIADASGNSLNGAWAALFADVVTKAGGVDKFCAAPGAGSGGGATAGAAAEEAAAVEEVVEEEEAPPAMDMFGGDDGGDY